MFIFSCTKLLIFLYNLSNVRESRLYSIPLREIGGEENTNMTTEVNPGGSMLGTNSQAFTTNM
jgi:hypothetical protein